MLKVPLLCIFLTTFVFAAPLDLKSLEFTGSISTKGSPDDAKKLTLTPAQVTCLGGLAAVPDYWGDFDEAFVRICGDPLMTEVSAVCFAGLSSKPEHWRYFNRTFYRNFNSGGIWEAFLVFCTDPKLTAAQARCIHGLAQVPDYFEPISHSIQSYCGEPGDPRLTEVTAHCIDALSQYPARWTPHFDDAVRHFCYAFPPPK